jgi:hypothetical protein
MDVLRLTRLKIFLKQFLHVPPVWVCSALVLQSNVLDLRSESKFFQLLRHFRRPTLPYPAVLHKSIPVKVFRYLYHRFFALLRGCLH